MKLRNVEKNALFNSTVMEVKSICLRGGRMWNGRWLLRPLAAHIYYVHVSLYLFPYKTFNIGTI